MKGLLGEINNEMDDYKRICLDLDRAVQPTGTCTALNVGLAQSKYTALRVFAENFVVKINQFIEALPRDGEENPILPINREPGYWWRPEVESAIKEEMDASLGKAADAMVCFKINTSAQVAENIMT